MDTKEFEETCRVLGDIAKHFPPGGRETKALERAAEALLFVFADENRQRYLKFLQAREEPLTPAQLSYLRTIGIDPDSWGEQ